VKLSLISPRGKEAIVATLGADDFLGEGCLASQTMRMSTATTVSDCTLFRIEKALMQRMLHEEHAISELFVAHLLLRNIKNEADLVDQLFNSSEKRLARFLLLLAHFGNSPKFGLLSAKTWCGSRVLWIRALRVQSFRLFRYRKYSKSPVSQIGCHVPVFEQHSAGILSSRTQSENIYAAIR
jgi:hypothetical protein